MSHYCHATIIVFLNVLRNLRLIMAVNGYGSYLANYPQNKKTPSFNLTPLFGKFAVGMYKKKSDRKDKGKQTLRNIK